jgi:hypothetical protein
LSFSWPGIYEFLLLPDGLEACLRKEEKIVEFSKSSTSGKLYLEYMIGNNVTSEVDALTYVVLSKAEQHMPYGEFVVTIECLML